MNERPLVLVIEEVRAELSSTVAVIKQRTGLPSTIIDGILCSVLADVRKEAGFEQTVAHAQEKENIRQSLEKASEEVCE